MFAPSQALIDDYCQNIVTQADGQDRKIQEMIRDYVKENLAPDPQSGLRERVMMLLFRGESAVRRIRETVGTFKENFLGGESIRDTYGDIVYNRDGSIRYFEPAVLAAPNLEEARTKIKIWARHSESDGGLLDKVVPTVSDPRHERTLVIIKPDNFKFPSGPAGQHPRHLLAHRPGHHRHQGAPHVGRAGGGSSTAPCATCSRRSSAARSARARRRSWPRRSTCPSPRRSSRASGACSGLWPASSSSATS
ncbi:MAG: hypothetical protein WDO13_08760 [Verrucomicrobiota bacterium]